MSSKSNTGEPTEYDAADEAALEAAADDAWAAYDGAGGGGTPSTIRVTAQVEWSGVVDRARGGVRTTRLDGLNLAPVREALGRARRTGGAAREARPASSYRAKGWHAQLSALLASKRGPALSDRAGLNPSARTVTAWLSTEREPSKENQRKIAEAYEGLRTYRVDAANKEHAAARHELAQALNAAIRDRYGAEVRLRDISSFRVE